MFKWITSFLLLLTLSIGINDKLIIAAQVPTKEAPVESSSNVKLEKIKHAADFTLFIPYFPHLQYKLEVKEPYPFEHIRSLQKVRLHFFDATGQAYIFGLEEHKAACYKVNQMSTYFDVREKTAITKTIVKDFKFKERGEIVNINGIEGQFEPWVIHSPGGYLRWIQSGTFLEIDSGVLTKQEMIELAESMN